MEDDRGRKESDYSTASNAQLALGDQVRVVRRYWWVVAIIAIVAVGSAVWSTAATPTTYMGRSSLIVSSNDRSPDQDAVLVQGYVEYFNDDAYQRSLLAKARVDPEATLTAQAAASSPILLVEATTGSFAQAQRAATAVARTFQNDINRVSGRENEAMIASLQEQLSSLEGNARNGPLASDLQDQIQQLQADQVNMLQELQFDGGVTVDSPSMARNAMLALVGGLLLGLVAALGTAALRARWRACDDGDDATAAAGMGSDVEPIEADSYQDEWEDEAAWVLEPSKRFQP